MYFLKIESTDNTDVLIDVDKIQYILQKKDGCVIGFDNGDRISTGAEFEDLEQAIEMKRR